MQKKQVNWILEKFISLCLKFLWTLLRDRKPLKKSLCLMFIRCHMVVIDGARMKIAVKIWPAFNTFVKHLMKLPKAKQPAKGEGKSFLVLKKAVDYPVIQAKMKFL